MYVYVHCSACTYKMKQLGELNCVDMQKHCQLLHTDTVFSMSNLYFFPNVQPKYVCVHA